MLAADAQIRESRNLAGKPLHRLGRHERRIWGWGGVADHATVKAETSESIRDHAGYVGKHRRA